MSIPVLFANSRFNRRKAKAWYILRCCRDSGQWLTASELAICTGLSVHSLRVALITWTSPSWRRVLRRTRPGTTVYEYRLSARGCDWIDRYACFIPEEWLEQMATWQHRMVSSGRLSTRR